MGDSKERYQRIQQECIDLLGGKCVRCGATEDLEFDHIDPSTKLFYIGGGSRVSREKLLAELAKCQLLCNRCHKEKTEEDLAKKRTHGSKTMWNRGCHCDECRNGQRIRMAEYKRNKRG